MPIDKIHHLVLNSPYEAPKEHWRYNREWKSQHDLARSANKRRYADRRSVQKQRGGDNSWLVGQPDVALHKADDGKWQVEACGFDYHALEHL